MTLRPSTLLNSTAAEPLKHLALDSSSKTVLPQLLHSEGLAELRLPRTKFVTTAVRDDFQAIDIKELTRSTDHPVVVVVDRFKSAEFGFPKMDLDGDAPPTNLSQNREIFHGELISKLIETNLPTAKIVKINWPVQQLAEDNSDGVAIFKELKRAKEAGYHISAVNCSMIPPVPLSFEELSKICEQKITPENIADNRQLVFLKILNWANIEPEKNIVKQQAKLAFDTMTAISELVRAGVPVYVSAGNNGPDYINMYSLAQGVISVGAIDAAGTQSEYSAEHSLITRKARGDFNVLAISKGTEGKGQDGVDFTGDGVSDLPLSALSSKGESGNSFIRELNGIESTKVTASASQIDLAVATIRDELKRLRLEGAKADTQLKFSTGATSNLAKDKELGALLFPISEILNKLGHKPEQITFAEKQLGALLHPSGLYFQVDSSNRVYYSPDGSEKAAIGAVSGTSFATPMAIVEDLKKQAAKSINSKQ